MIKHIVITGASRGIGKKIADHFSLLHGYKVTNISRKKNNNPKIINYSCDVSNYSAVKRIFKKIKNIDVLINNAAFTGEKFSTGYIEKFEKQTKD